MFFNETFIPQTGIPDSKYGVPVLNPDGSLVGGGSVNTTPYKMLAYYDNTDPNYNYSYYAEGLAGTDINTAGFRCFRITEDKNGVFLAKEWAGVGFNHLGTESYVKSLTYN